MILLTLLLMLRWRLWPPSNGVQQAVSPHAFLSPKLAWPIPSASRRCLLPAFLRSTSPSDWPLSLSRTPCMRVPLRGVIASLNSWPVFIIIFADCIWGSWLDVTTAWAAGGPQRAGQTIILGNICFPTLIPRASIWSHSWWRRCRLVWLRSPRLFPLLLWLMTSLKTSLYPPLPLRRMKRTMLSLLLLPFRIRSRLPPPLRRLPHPHQGISRGLIHVSILLPPVLVIARRHCLIILPVFRFHVVQVFNFVLSQSPADRAFLLVFCSINCWYMLYHNTEFAWPTLVRQFHGCTIMFLM